MLEETCVLPAMTYDAKTWKEQDSSHTNKDGKEYVKHHIPGQKNKHLGKKKDTGHRADLCKPGDGSGHGHGTSAGYEITDGHWKPYERKRPRGRAARRWKYELDENRRCGSSMLRPSPNHWILWLHNDE